MSVQFKGRIARQLEEARAKRLEAAAPTLPPTADGHRLYSGKRKRPMSSDHLASLIKRRGVRGYDEWRRIQEYYDWQLGSKLHEMIPDKDAVGIEKAGVVDDAGKDTAEGD